MKKNNTVSGTSGLKCSRETAKITFGKRDCALSRYPGDAIIIGSLAIDWETFVQTFGRNKRQDTRAIARHRVGDNN